MKLFGIEVKFDIDDFQQQILKTFNSEIQKLLFLVDLKKFKKTYTNLFSDIIEYISEYKPYLIYQLLKVKNSFLKLDIATKLEKVKDKKLRRRFIRILSMDNNKLVRATISILPSTPLYILKRLMNDESKLVSEEAKGSEKLLQIYGASKDPNYNF